MFCCVVKTLKCFAVGAAILALTACAGSPVSGGDSNKLNANENGGKISDALGPAQSQSMDLVSSHCAKHDKKGFITKMDYDQNSITFECHKQAVRS